MERGRVAVGDRVAIVGSGVRWLVVDHEVDLATLARPLVRAGGKREVKEIVAHMTALVVIERAS